MKRQMIAVASLKDSEKVQDQSQIRRVAEAMGGNPEEIIWDDQPAIIVDTEGNILDGHHRVAAARLAGLPQWPAIIVCRADWDIRAAVSHRHAAQWACDEAEDSVTWGSV